MNAKTVIACDVYDVAEAACTQGRDVVLRLNDGQTLSGQAIDIQATDDAEFLVLQAQDRRLLVRLRAVAEIGFDSEA